LSILFVRLYLFSLQNNGLILLKPRLVLGSSFVALRISRFVYIRNFISKRLAIL